MAGRCTVAGNQGLKLGRAFLEDGAGFKGPCFVDGLPRVMGCDNGSCLLEVRSVIGAKVQPRFGDRVAGGCGEEVVAQNPMFVMTYLRPGVGKEDEEPREAGADWQDFEKESGVGLKEGKVVESGAIPFAQGAIDTLSHEIDADAWGIGMSLSVSG